MISITKNIKAMLLQRDRENLDIRSENKVSIMKSERREVLSLVFFQLYPDVRAALDRRAMIRKQI